MRLLRVSNAFRGFRGGRRLDRGRKRRRRQSRRRILGLELGGGAGSRTGGGSAEAPQRLGSGARPGSLQGRLSGTGWNHREWLERSRGGWGRVLDAGLVPPFVLAGRSRSMSDFFDFSELKSFDW